MVGELQGEKKLEKSEGMVVARKRKTDNSVRNKNGSTYQFPKVYMGLACHLT